MGKDLDILEFFVKIAPLEILINTSNNMKKLFFSLFSFVVFMCQAGTVTKNEALQKASQFLRNEQIVGIDGNRKLELAPDLLSDQPFYVYNLENQGGFIIVSGDNRTPAILGYSFHGNLSEETLPCNMRWLLNYYKEAINNLNSTTISERKNDRSEIRPMVVTQWGQSAPYNSLCPYADGSQCLTGCVATSMAQVINYNRWPQGQTSPVDEYVSNSYHIVMPELSSTQFNWDIMNDIDKARLMLYCGQSVQMDYGPAASGAFVDGIPSALKDVFGYSESTHLAMRGNYNQDSWESLIYLELSEGRPMVYNGQDQDGGHSFIICGYKEGLFYVNWGWNGNCDGYFDLTSLTPGNGTDFSSGQIAIIGIQPPAGAGDITRPKAVVQEMTSSEIILGRNSDTGLFPSFTVGCTVVSNLVEDGTVQLGVGLYDNNDLLQAFPSTNHKFYGIDPFTYNQEITLPADLPDGNYSIRAINRMQDDDDWLSNAGSSDHYILACIEDDELQLQVMPVDDEWYEELGICTIDGITYHLYCICGCQYKAEVLAYKETEQYSGDIYIPDSITYMNMRIKVFYALGAFNYCERLKSLSLAANANINSCSQLKTLDIRQGATTFSEIESCPLLEEITYPQSVFEAYMPQMCSSLKTIRFNNTRNLKLNWSYYITNPLSAESLPALTDIYFAAEYPPIADREVELMEVNPNVTIHVPKGMLPLYQKSAWKDWRIIEDLPAIPASVKWDYCGVDKYCWQGVAVGRGENNVEFAMCVPASHLSAYKGCRITKIEFFSSEEGEGEMYTDGSAIDKVQYVFITKLGADYLVKQDVCTIRDSWNTIKLDQPIIIDGDQLFVGIGRKRALGFSWANLNVEDEAFYMRVMGTDFSWDMGEEIGLWQKHAGETDWNHPMPIRFYIEGENLPTDVLINQSGFVQYNGNQPQRQASAVMYNPKPQNGYYNINTAYPKRTASSHSTLLKTEDDPTRLELSVRSRCISTINTLTLDWMIDNKYAGSQSFDTYLLPNHEDTFVIDMPSDISGRNHQVEVYVTKINGEPDAIKVNSCDTLIFTKPATTRFPRRIVMEEVTGTWCGYCPRGIETIRLALEEYPSNFIPIAIHGGDVMYPENGSFNPILELSHTIPYSLINRTLKFDPRWPGIKEIIEEYKDKADAIITANAYFGGADSSFVRVDTEITFGYDDEGTTDYRMAYVVLEDKVGPYWQTNYYSDPDVESNPYDYMDGWIHSAYQVEMQFDHVARVVVPDWLGVEGSLPQVINEGQVYQNKYQFKLPSNVENKNNLRIVALLIDNTAGEIMNAAQCPINYDETQDGQVIWAENNPGALFDVYSSSGILIKKQVNSFVGLPHGIYIIRSSKKVMKYCQ